MKKRILIALVFSLMLVLSLVGTASAAQVTPNGSLLDRFSCGGKVNSVSKHVNISFAGWAGNCAGYTNGIGSFEVIFHNVGHDQYDKAKFTTKGIVELYRIEYLEMPALEPAPPESMGDRVILQVEGTLVVRGQVIESTNGGWYLGILACDGGEKPPEIAGNGDAIRIMLYDGEPIQDNKVIDSAVGLVDNGNGSLHLLDAGNVQIVVPYELPSQT